jgi:nucleoside-diphosphate-sugar epimerase
MRSEKVLIVGCGDLGTRLGLLLAAEGCEVFGMRRDAAAIPAPIHAIAGDATDPAAYAGLPSSLDLAFYTASASGVADEAGYRRAYVDGPAAMLGALAALGLAPRRLVFASSTAVHGQDDGSTVDEDSPTEPPDFRGRVMLEGERVVLGGPWPATVVRLGGIYGPGRTWLIDGLKSGRIGLSADGRSPWTNRIHVDDAARALAHLARLPAPAPVYLGVDAEPARRDEVLRGLAARVGGSERGRGGDKRCTSARLSASGFTFRYPSYREGYAEVIGS